MVEKSKRYCSYGGFRYEVYVGEKDPNLTLSEYIAYHGDKRFSEWFRMSKEHARALRYTRDRPTEVTIREVVDRTPILRENCLPPNNKKVIVSNAKPLVSDSDKRRHSGKPRKKQK